MYTTSLTSSLTTVDPWPYKFCLTFSCLSNNNSAWFIPLLFYWSKTPWAEGWVFCSLSNQVAFNKRLVRSLWTQRLLTNLWISPQFSYNKLYYVCLASKSLYWVFRSSSEICSGNYITISEIFAIKVHVRYVLKWFVSRLSVFVFCLKIIQNVLR